MNQAAFEFLDEGYPPGFSLWLQKNKHIWNRFERMALDMAKRGRARYSARCIIEALRYNTELADTDAQFKINNVFVPGLARKFMAKHGERFPKFFELREQ